MVTDADKKGLAITVGRDRRITRVGAILRKTKLDELAQLLNVLAGQMSFVGPRPEVERYVRLYTPYQRQVLLVRPGITDYASIAYRNENDLLAGAEDPEKMYIEQIMPDKIELNMKYLREISPLAPVVTAGSAAVLIGAQNGLFPDMGYAVPGEMGGLWAGEKKICDGFFLAVDDVPLTQADACEIHPVVTAFHYRMQKERLHVVRRQFIPDGVSGCVIELTIENLKNAPRMAEVSFTVRTDILTAAAARGEDGAELGRDVGEYDEQEQAFFARDSRNPWHAVWGAQTGCRVLQADLPQSIYGFGNTQGKGVNGRLFYRLRLAANAQATMRLYIAGGYPSRSKAEEALALLRGQAETMLEEKRARIEGMKALSDATLPDAALEQCVNWAKLYADWMLRTLPRGGCALCCELPENPALYGEGWAKAMEALLPLGGAARVQEMLRTLVDVSAQAQLAPGRVARSVSLSGKVLQAGGERESAQFVALVHHTLLWSGDRAFAADMLPMTGLCVNYLRRSTRSFEDVQEDMLAQVRAALVGHAYVLKLTGADDAATLALLDKLPAEPEQGEIAPNATLAERARWHGEHEHVEQVIVCMEQMAASAAPGLPGSVRTEDAAPGVLLQARAAEGMIRPAFECLFGVKPDAGRKAVAWRPHTPIGWEGWKLENLRIGDASFDLISERVSPSRARYTIRTAQQGWTVCVTENGEEKALPLDGEISVILED